MKTNIRFTKMSGAGNDFVLIDNMNGSLRVDKSKLSRVVCSRHFGVGADGLLLIERSSIADFSMKYYNADGSYGGMCGNGGRCIARYAVAMGIVPESTVKFEALDQIYSAEIIHEAVKLQMKEVKHQQLNILIQLEQSFFEGHFIDTGSPHVVIECEKLDELDVTGIGKEIRYHELFAPEGANVDFIRVAGDNELDLRTYERGVEGETLACGTGAVASSLIASLLKDVSSPVTLNVKSGEQLTVYFKRDGNLFTDVYLEGSASFLFSGVLQYDLGLHKILDSTNI